MLSTVKSQNKKLTRNTFVLPVLPTVGNKKTLCEPLQVARRNQRSLQIIIKTESDIQQSKWTFKLLIRLRVPSHSQSKAYFYSTLTKFPHLRVHWFLLSTNSPILLQPAEFIKQKDYTMSCCAAGPHCSHMVACDQTNNFALF